MTTHDRAWSRINSISLWPVLGLLWFCHNGFFPFVSGNPLADDQRITADYYDWIIASFALFALGVAAYRYLKFVNSVARQGCLWPRLLGIEDDGREPFISRVCFASTTGLLFLGWVGCLVRYTDSRIVCWHASDTSTALGNGFLSDRWQAMITSSGAWSGPPRLRMHPPDGVEFFPFLSDFGPLALTIAALTFWGLWFRMAMSQSRP